MSSVPNDEDRLQVTLTRVTWSRKSIKKKSVLVAILIAVLSAAIIGLMSGAARALIGHLLQ